MIPLVVDACVGFKWICAEGVEQDVAPAHQILRDHAAAIVHITVPALFFYEIGNILRFNHAGLSALEAEAALGDLYALSIEVSGPDSMEARDTIRLAQKYELTFYDAGYLALAEAIGCDLITADVKLAKKAARSGRIRDSKTVIGLLTCALRQRAAPSTITPPSRPEAGY